MLKMYPYIKITYQEILLTKSGVSTATTARRFLDLAFMTLNVGLS